MQLAATLPPSSWRRKEESRLILVTGATGFIGTNLVQQLASGDEPVRILRRQSSNMLGLEGLPIEEVVGDILDEASVREAVKDCRRVYHVAGSADIGPFSSEQLYRTNVFGTEQVARAALAEGVEKLVYTSSSVTIGYGSAENPATEDSDYNLGHIPLPYIKTKKAAEEKVLELVAQGLPAVIVNPGYVFGCWDKEPKLNQLLIKSARGKLNFFFPGGMSVVDVDDVATGHILAMEAGQIGQRYILSNRNMTYREFVTVVNASQGKRPPKWKLPYPLLLTMGYASECCGKLFRFNPLLSSGLAQLYAIDHFVSSQKAETVLGYKTTPLEESLDRTFHWLRGNDYISF
jgi:dihydroflavonol-4-reductase